MIPSQRHTIDLFYRRADQLFCVGSIGRPTRLTSPEHSRPATRQLKARLGRVSIWTRPPHACLAPGVGIGTRPSGRAPSGSARLMAVHAGHEGTYRRRPRCCRRCAQAMCYSGRSIAASLVSCARVRRPSTPSRPEPPTGRAPIIPGCPCGSPWSHNPWRCPRRLWRSLGDRCPRRCLRRRHGRR
jgi:hypothetical protein